MTLDRNKILDALTKALEPQDFVLAFWEGGAAGFGRADEWSDIDAQAIVLDDRVEDAFKVVEKALEELSGVERKFRLPEPTWHGHSQCFYKLENASPFLFVDLAIMKEHTEADKFDMWATHGRPVVRFDKKGLVKEVKIAPEEHAKAIMKRLEMLKNLFELFYMLPLKETYRKNHIEAMYFYLGQTYRPLIEVLRMKHCPQRYNYGSRYVYYDLPEDVVKRLEKLMFFPPEEMEKKVNEVAEWFRKVAATITEEEIQRILNR